MLGFALPNVCIACDSILEGNIQFICNNCRSKLVRFEDAHPWKEEQIRAGTIDDSFSLYRFIAGSEIQALLHAMKYEKMKSIGKMFGAEIGEALAAKIKLKFDYAIPVPLHKAKERERTYNQSDYICKGICSVLKTECLSRSLIRTRFTKSQTKLTRAERQANIQGAFRINPKQREKIEGKNIILTDDVMTTGSTILECAGVLKQNGCGNVILCSIAYDLLD